MDNKDNKTPDFDRTQPEHWINQFGKFVALGLFAIVFANVIISAFAAVLHIVLVAALVSVLLIRLSSSQSDNCKNFRRHFSGCIVPPINNFLRNHVTRNFLFLIGLAPSVIAISIDALAKYTRLKPINLNNKLWEAIDNAVPSSPYKSEAGSSVGVVCYCAVAELFITPFYIAYSIAPNILGPVFEKIGGPGTFVNDFKRPEALDDAAPDQNKPIVFGNRKT